MAGNVCEWCSDWYSGSYSSSVTNPTGPTSGAFRVHRGGSWFSPARRLRSARRDGYDPGDANGFLGFRVLDWEYVAAVELLEPTAGGYEVEAEPTIRAQDIQITITGNASVQENETANYEIKVANTNPKAEDEFRIEIRLNGLAYQGVANQAWSLQTPLKPNTQWRAAYKVTAPRPGNAQCTVNVSFALGEDVLQSLTKDIQITAKPSAPSYPGFTYLRTQTYFCGGVTNTVKEYRHDRSGLEFVLIPGGTFTMGSPSGESGRDDDEGPQHQVTLSPYLISKTEVTQAVWERVMESNPSHFKGADRPVENVSWNDCVSFCEKTGLALPTEAQWEFACRARTKTAYYWGESFDLSQCNSASYWTKQVLRTNGQSLEAGTTSVGKFSPNVYGLYDMVGNVWEWCYDWYSNSYPSNSVTDPVGPTSSALRVIRGGSWDGAARALRSANRGNGDPCGADSKLGFRVLAGRP